jgi:hypothetical protein
VGSSLFRISRSADWQLVADFSAQTIGAIFKGHAFQKRVSHLDCGGSLNHPTKIRFVLLLLGVQQRCCTSSNGWPPSVGYTEQEYYLQIN